jgi:phospholipase/lecithinase/hemolysin
MILRCLLSVLPLVLFATAVGASPLTRLYVFGDSLSDNGNLYRWTGQPNPVTGGTPIPVAPPYASGRFQDGPSYAERLWEALGLSGELTPSFLGGSNYAVGGARSRYHNFDLANGLPPAPEAVRFGAFSLLGQVDAFRADLRGRPADAQALYVVWGGANDLQDVVTLAGRAGVNAASARLAEAARDVADVLTSLVSLGARELFVPNAPDLGIVPAVIAQGPRAVAAATAYSAAFNALVDDAIVRLGAGGGVHIERFDAFSLVRDIVADPARYGVTDTRTPCLANFYIASPLDPAQPVAVCNDPRRMFWDIVHPAAGTHGILARQMIAAIPEPAPWLLLASALALARVRASRAASRSRPQPFAP